MDVRILLVDDHKLVRKGLRELLEANVGMTVVGEAEDGRAAVTLTAKLKPSIVIMDVSMPELNGIEATRQIVRDHDDVPVLGLSMHDDRQTVSQMLQAGASGYLTKDAAVNELAKAVSAVANGLTYLSPAISGPLVEDYVRSDATVDEPAAFSLLTDRERQILQLVAEGNTTKEIADVIGRSTKTVESHRRNLMNKLDIHNIAELTKFAIRQGVTDLT